MNGNDLFSHKPQSHGLAASGAQPEVLEMAKRSRVLKTVQQT
jgi:hypothetical protein